MFERLKDALDTFLDSATKHDPRDVTRKMHAAVVEARAALMGLREDLSISEQKLQRERDQLADAERRGRMAREIGDSETADIADQYTEKHREHVDVLERKVIAQRHEIELAEREFDDMKTQLRQAKDRGGVSSDQMDEAWRSLESVGSPSSDGGADDALRTRMDRAAREVAAESKLEELKKKMGR